MYAEKYKLKPRWIQYTVDSETILEMFTEVLKDLTGFEGTIDLYCDEEDNTAYVSIDDYEVEEEELEKLNRHNVPWDETSYMAEWLLQHILPGAAAYLEYMFHDSPELMISVRIPEEAIEEQ